MEENLTTKTSYVKSLNKVNISKTIVLNVDANANIKTILNTEAFLFDIKTECSAGKAVLTGKIGVKLLYVDTDNITATLTESQSISETIVDASITQTSYINACNSNISCNVQAETGGVKVVCDVCISPTMYINLALPVGDAGFENLIVKKSEINTCSIESVVDCAFNYSVNFETRDSVAKILMYNCRFAEENITSQQGKLVVEGKLFSTLVYETAGEGGEIKEICDVFNLKTDVECQCNEEEILDVCLFVDNNKTTFSTSAEEDGNLITINHTMLIKGVCMKIVAVEMLDDLYSTENEVELATTNREYCANVNCNKVEQSVSGEVQLGEDEPAIEKIVACLNVQPEITNNYVKDGCLMVEGVVSSCVIYLDENKEYKQKKTEIPFIINTKIEMQNPEGVHVKVCTTDCRTRVKRGTILEQDITLKFNICNFVKQEKEMLDNFTLGKPLDFGKYDYQIYIAKSGETMWQLGKRTKVAPEELALLNPNLPVVMEGGEKIIVKR